MKWVLLSFSTLHMKVEVQIGQVTCQGDRVSRWQNPLPSEKQIEEKDRSSEG